MNLIPASGKIRILIADDHTLFRGALSSMLSRELDIEVAGDAATGDEAVARSLELSPDVVLMDAAMPGLSAFEATRRIRTERPAAKVLFVSMYDDEEYLDAALKAGASGYLLKETQPEDLIAAVRGVTRNGGSYVSPRMLAMLTIKFRDNTAVGNQPRVKTLTGRELQMLKALAEGRSVKEIAFDLQLSIKTVDSHKYNLMRKLDIHNKAQLVHYAIQKKIVRVGDVPRITSAEQTADRSSL